MIDSINFLNQTLTVTMNRPLGTVHPRFPSIVYSANYGYISGVMGKDRADLDAYVLGIDEPLVEFEGLCVGVIERLNDEDDKLIVIPPDDSISDDEIFAQTHFQERYFDIILFRRAIAADLPKIIALDQDLFGWYGAAENAKTIEKRLMVFPAGFWVVIDGESRATIGYCSLEKWLQSREPALDEDPSLTHHPEGHVLCITTLAIQREHQRRGLGTRILKRVIAFADAQACRQIILETAYAVEFYERHGFEVVGVRQERGINLSIMRLEKGLF